MTLIAKWSLFLLMCLMLSGCPLPLQPMSTTPETELFAQGLDQHLATGDLTTLNQLVQEYPQGEWRTQAEGIIDLAQRQQHQLHQLQQQQQLLQQQQQQTLLVKKNQKIDKLQDKKALTQCQQEKVAVEQDNLLLEKTLKRLKEVLIDTELQAK